METSITGSGSWTVEEAEGSNPLVTIFGQKGQLIDEKTWRLTGSFGGLQELSPRPMRDTLIELVSKAEGKILCIGVMARIAVVLFLQGVISLETLEESEEDGVTIHLLVELNGEPYILAVMPDHCMAKEVSVYAMT